MPEPARPSTTRIGATYDRVIDWVVATSLLALALVAGWHRARTAALFAAALAVAWALAVVLIQTDAGDADGYMDCWPRCSMLQHAVGLAFWGAPVLLVAVLIGVLAARLARRRAG